MLPKDNEALPRLIGESLIDIIAESIICLEFEPGTQLIEEEFCNRFNISRAPVREAMHVLCSEGLLERKPRRGVFVPFLSIERLDEICACRVPLEGLAAASVARTATSAIIAQLEACLNDMKRGIRRGNTEDAFVANVRLTTSIHMNCQNSTLQKILTTLDRQALRYRFFCYNKRSDFIKKSLNSNALIVQAIREKNETDASMLTQELVQDSWKMIRNIIKD